MKNKKVNKIDLGYCWLYIYADDKSQTEVYVKKEQSLMLINNK